MNSKIENLPKKVTLSYYYKNRNYYKMQIEISEIFKSTDIENELNNYINNLPDNKNIDEYTLVYDDNIVYSKNTALSEHMRLKLVINSEKYDLSDKDVIYYLNNSPSQIDISYKYINNDKVGSRINLKDVFKTNNIEKDIDSYIKNLPRYNEIKEWTVIFNNKILFSSDINKVEGYYKFKYVLTNFFN